MRAPSMLLTSCAALPCKKAGSWNQLCTATVSRTECSPSVGDVVAIAYRSASTSSDIRQAVSQLTASNALLTEAATPSTIRTLSALLFHSLGSRPVDGPMSTPAQVRSTLSGEQRFASAEFFAALLTAQGNQTRGGVDVGIRALLDSHIRLKAGADEDTTKPATGVAFDENMMVSRCWSRTFIGGLITALKQSVDDEGPVMSRHNLLPLHSSNTPPTNVFLQICVLSLCNSADEMRQWIDQSSSLKAWPLHVIVAAGSALRLLDDNKKSSEAQAHDACDFLCIIVERIAPLSKLEELLPLDSSCGSISPIAFAAFTYLVAALCSSDTHVAEGARWLTKFHHSRTAASVASNGAASSLQQSTPTFLPSALLHRVVRQQLVQVFSAASPPSAIDVSTVVGLIQQDRDRFNAVAASTKLSKFELSALQPKLAGDPIMVSWALRTLAARLQQHNAAHAPQHLQHQYDVVDQIRIVLTSVYPRSIVAACVPSDRPLEVLLEAAPQDDRKALVGDLIGAIASAVGAVIRSSSCGQDSGADVVAPAALLLTELLTLWASKGTEGRKGKGARAPLWKQRLDANGVTSVRTHKMEVLRGELPHGILSSMCWDWLYRGFTAPALMVLGALLDKDYLDVHYYPLALLSSARCSVRLDPALLGASETVKLITAFHQRFSLFDESSLAANSQASTSSQLMVVEQRESLVYPELHRIKQSAVLGPFGSTIFGYLPRSALHSGAGNEMIHRRPAVAWKSVSSAVVM
jgi:hypothetical protein